MVSATTRHWQAKCVFRAMLSSMNCSVHRNQIGSWSIIGVNSCVTKSAIVERDISILVFLRRSTTRTLLLYSVKKLAKKAETAKNRFVALREARGFFNNVT